MGKKRKSGQDEAAPPQTAEQVVLSVDDEGKPVEPAEQVLADSPVPDIGAGAAEPPPKKRKKKLKQLGSSGDVSGEVLEPSKEIGVVPPELPPLPKKNKQKKVDSADDVAGEASEPLKEIGIEQAAPPELPLPKKKKKVEAAGKASEPSEEIGLVHVALPEIPPSNPTVGVECVAEKLSSNPMAESEAKPADVPAQKRKKRRKQKHGTPCVNDVEKNDEEKMNNEVPKTDNVDEGVEPVKKQKKKLMEAKIDEEEGPVRKKKKKNKSSEAENIEGLLKPVQVVARKKGSEVPVTVCVGVETNVDGRTNERQEVAKLLRMHGLTRAVEEVGNKDEVVSTMPSLEERPSLIPTDMEWRKRQLVWGLLQYDGAEKQKEKESKEENVGQQKENINENAEAQKIEHPEICVICRQKGHTISTCSLLDPPLRHAKQTIAKLKIRTRGGKRGGKAFNLRAEKLASRKGSLVKDGAAENLSDSNEAKQTVAKLKIRTRGGKRGGKTLKLRAEKLAARKAESIVKDIATQKLSNSNEAKQTIPKLKKTRGGKRGGKALKLRAEKLAATKAESIVKDGAAEKLSDSNEAKQTIPKLKKPRRYFRSAEALKLREEKRFDQLEKIRMAEDLKNQARKEHQAEKLQAGPP